MTMRRPQLRPSRPQPSMESSGGEKEEERGSDPVSKFRFRFMDDPPGGGYAVACTEPGVSGQWVYGKDRADALKNWEEAYAVGQLTE